MEAHVDGSRLRLPLPTPVDNSLKLSFTLTDSVNGLEVAPDPNSELATAELCIAADGSFVETTSANAARELKRRYDQLWGVGQDGKRSPYAITAVVNQFGRRVFRVSHHEEQIPSDDQLHLPPPPEDDAKETRPKHSRASLLFGRSTLPKQSRHSHGFSTAKSKSSTSPPSLRHVFTGPSPSRSIPELSGTHQGPSIFPSNLSFIGQRDSTRSTVSSISLDFTSPRASAIRPADTPDTTPSVHTNGSSSARSSSIIRPFGPFITFSAPVVPEPVSPHHGEFSFVDVTDASNSPLAISKLPPLRASLIPALHNARSFDSNSTARGLRTSTPTPMTRSHPPLALPMFAKLVELFDIFQAKIDIPSSTFLDAEFRNSHSTTAPNNDPRFVLWGVAAPPEPLDLPGQPNFRRTRAASDQSDARVPSTGRYSRPNLAVSTAASSTMSSTSSTVAVSVTPSFDNLRSDASVSTSVGNQVLLAASIERWVAQLTSELNYDELLDFFLTYRTYISSLELLHLFISRFHWSLTPSAVPGSGPPEDEEDTPAARAEIIKRVVRVRTFIALRYWLLTFFRVDFLPAPKLGLVLTTWLNVLHRSPWLHNHPDAANIVKTLKGLVRECKANHVVDGEARLSSSQRKISLDGATPRPSAIFPSPTPLECSPLLVSLFPDPSIMEVATEDPDVDLDFSIPIPSANGNAEFTGETLHNGEQPSDNSRGLFPTGISSYTPALPRSRAGSAARQPEPHAMLPQGDMLTTVQAALLQPLHLSIPAVASASTAGSSAASPSSPGSPPLPMHHSKVTRAFVNTIGKFGRWKRVLNPRTSLSLPPQPSDDQEFDLELNEADGRYHVRGGLEQFLKMMDMPLVDDRATSNLEVSHETNDPVQHPVVQVSDLENGDETHVTVDEGEVSESSSYANDAFSLNESIPSEHISEDHVGESLISDRREMAPAPLYVQYSPQVKSNRPSRFSASTWRSSLSSLGNLLPRRSFAEVTRPPPGLFDGSLDDYDLSDSDDSAKNDRQRRLVRRMPQRRDFQFVRQSLESMSSTGLQSSKPESEALSSHSHDGDDRAAIPLQDVQPWQLRYTRDDSDDEPGDAEAALRRLEGQVNAGVQQAKSKKVDNWLKKVQERLAAQERGVDFTEEDEAAAAARAEEDAQEEGRDSDPDVAEAEVEDITITRPPSFAAETPDVDPPAPQEESEAVSEDPSAPLSEADEASPINTGISITPAPSESLVVPPPSQRVPSPLTTGIHSPRPPINYHSFILLYRSTALAHHFTLIDQDLFLSIKFDQLVSLEWARPVNELLTLDWELFLKDRQRLRVAARDHPDQNLQTISDVTAVRTRFALMSAFTATEIILTNVNERHIIINKLIRVAWKLYSIGNYFSLVSIIQAIQSDTVQTGMRKHWHRVGKWESRVLNDLIPFTSSSQNYRFIRESMTAMADTRFSVPSHASTTSSGDYKPRDTKPSCIPLLNVYLSELFEYALLPNHVDPTSPYTRRSPACLRHPQVFSSLPPLPEGVEVRPLINVQKQRLIAGLVKSVVAGQHLASNYHFDFDRLDPSLRQKCLRIRTLEATQLRQLASM